MNKKYAPTSVAILVGLIVVSLFLAVGYAENQRYRETLRGAAIDFLSQLRAKLEAEVNANFYLTRGLIAYIETQPQLSQEDFHAWSNNLLRHHNSIINIGLAPGNILSFVHPLEGNEKALGLNYEKNEKQWPAVKMAIDARKTVVAGPVKLLQGGVAFISRTPIYLDSDAPWQEQKYWGLASIVISKDVLFRSAGFYAEDSDMAVAIRGTDGLGAAGEVFDGQAEVFQQQPVLLDVQLPAGSWQLAAVPKAGWQQNSPNLIWIYGCGLVLAMAASCGVFSWVRRVNRVQMRIRRAWENAENAGAELRKSESFLNAIIQNIPHVIFVKDAKELRYLRFNRAAEDLTGHLEQELLGKNDYDLFPKEEADCFIANDRTVLNEKTMLTIAEEKVSTRYKGERLLCTKKIPVLAVDGTPEYLLGIAEDITERHRAEQERLLLENKLQQAQKMEAIGLMAGGVAHDLNNILAAITGYPELMLRKLPLDSDLRKPLQMILDSGKRGVAVVADMLTVARGAASAREAVSLNRLIKEYLESPECLNAKKYFPHGRLQADLAADLPQILASPVHIKKCLMNLVNNAIEAMNGKGSITLTTWSETVVGESRNGYQLEDGDYVVLRVADDGPGISASDIERIFEPFYTKKMMGKGGTGLGLTVVWNTVKDHGGSIFVASGPAGTFFYLYFPVCPAENAAPRSGNEPLRIFGRGQKVLVVDDEQHIRDIANQILDAAGYRVATVSGGEEAVAYVSENPVDLLVIDMMMGPGINGCETYRRIVARYPGQKALITSGFSDSVEVKSALALGASHFVSKPYSMDQLCQAVSLALSENGGSYEP